MRHIKEEAARAQAQIQADANQEPWAYFPWDEGSFQWADERASVMPTLQPNVPGLEGWETVMPKRKGGES